MKKLGLPCARRGNFRGAWESWSKNVILTFSVTIWVWTLPLSPLSCIPFIQLLSILLWFIKTERKRHAFIESLLWVKGIYGHIRATTWIFLLALLPRYAVCSLKLYFLSIINPSRLSQLLFSIEQSSSGSFAVMSKLEKRWHLFCLAFMPFLRKYLKVLPRLLLICFQLGICFFKYCREYCRPHKLQHLLHQPE